MPKNEVKVTFTGDVRGMLRAQQQVADGEDRIQAELRQTAKAAEDAERRMGKAAADGARRTATAAREAERATERTRRPSAYGVAPIGAGAATTAAISFGRSGSSSGVAGLKAYGVRAADRMAKPVDLAGAFAGAGSFRPGGATAYDVGAQRPIPLFDKNHQAALALGDRQRAAAGPSADLARQRFEVERPGALRDLMMSNLPAADAVGERRRGRRQEEILRESRQRVQLEQDAAGRRRMVADGERRAGRRAAMRNFLTGEGTMFGGGMGQLLGFGGAAVAGMVSKEMLASYFDKPELIAGKNAEFERLMTPYLGLGDNSDTLQNIRRSKSNVLSLAVDGGVSLDQAAQSQFFLQSATSSMSGPQRAATMANARLLTDTKGGELVENVGVLAKTMINTGLEARQAANLLAATEEEGILGFAELARHGAKVFSAFTGQQYDAYDASAVMTVGSRTLGFDRTTDAAKNLPVKMQQMFEVLQGEGLLDKDAVVSNDFIADLGRVKGAMAGQTAAEQTSLMRKGVDLETMPLLQALIRDYDEVVRLEGKAKAVAASNTIGNKQASRFSDSRYLAATRHDQYQAIEQNAEVLTLSGFNPSVSADEHLANNSRYQQILAGSRLANAGNPFVTDDMIKWNARATYMADGADDILGNTKEAQLAARVRDLANLEQISGLSGADRANAIYKRAMTRIDDAAALDLRDSDGSYFDANDKAELASLRARGISVNLGTLSESHRLRDEGFGDRADRYLARNSEYAGDLDAEIERARGAARRLRSDGSLETFGPQEEMVVLLRKIEGHLAIGADPDAPNRQHWGKTAALRAGVDVAAGGLPVSRLFN